MSEDRDRIGLCRTCRHAQQVPSRHRVYWLCRLAATDARFAKYPRLPVTGCEGYARVEVAAGPDAPEPPRAGG